METFRMLTIADIDVYYSVLHRGYQSIRQYPISFAAVTVSKEESCQWLQANPTYGLFVDGQLVSAISLRMPWGPNPGPRQVPHIGWFVTNPDYKHQGYATRLLSRVETEILKKNLKAPLVTLGTAGAILGFAICMRRWDLNVMIGFN